MFEKQARRGVLTRGPVYGTGRVWGLVTPRARRLPGALLSNLGFGLLMSARGLHPPPHVTLASFAIYSHFGNFLG